MSLGAALVLLLRFYICPSPQLSSAPTPAFPSISLDLWLLRVTFSLKRNCSKSLPYSSQAQLLRRGPRRAGGWSCGSAHSRGGLFSLPQLPLAEMSGRWAPMSKVGLPFLRKQVKHVASQRCDLTSRAEIPLHAQLLQACIFCLHGDRAGEGCPCFSEWVSYCFLKLRNCVQLQKRKSFLICTYHITCETMQFTPPHPPNYNTILITFKFTRLCFQGIFIFPVKTKFFFLPKFL